MLLLLKKGSCRMDKKETLQITITLCWFHVQHIAPQKLAEQRVARALLRVPQHAVRYLVPQHRRHAAVAHRNLHQGGHVPRQYAVLVRAFDVLLDERVGFLHALPLPPRSRRRVGGGALLQTEHLPVEPIGGCSS
jgi:hypothetical protein